MRFITFLSFVACLALWSGNVHGGAIVPSTCSGDEFFNETLGACAPCDIISQIGGVLLHFDSSRGVSTDGGNFVDVWADQSSGSYDATSAPTGTTPVYHPEDTRFGGQPSIEFARSHWLRVDDNFGTALCGVDHMTMFMVARSNPFSDLPKSNIAFSMHSESGTNRFRMGVDPSAGSIFISYRSGTSNLDETSTESGFVSNPFLLSTFGPAGAASGPRLVFGNGTALSGFASTRPTFCEVTPTRTSIAQEYDSGFSITDIFNGEIAELLIFDSALPTEYREAVEGFLSSKYGGGFVSSTHTFGTSTAISEKSFCTLPELPPTATPTPSVTPTFSPTSTFTPEPVRDCSTIGPDTVVPSLLVHYIGDDAVNSSGVVGTWPDSSGNGHDATSSGTARPGYEGASADFNGHTALSFSGAQWMGLDGAASDICNAEIVSIFIVANPIQYSGSEQTNIMFSAHTSSNGNLYRLGFNPSNLGVFVGFTGQGRATASPTGVTGPSIVFHQTISNYQSGTFPQEVRVNGVLKSGYLSTLVEGWGCSSSTVSKVSIGMEWDSLPTDFFRGDIAEIMVFDGELTAAERQDIEGYLHKKYSTASNDLVDLSHPWFTCA